MAQNNTPDAAETAENLKKSSEAAYKALQKLGSTKNLSATEKLLNNISEKFSEILKSCFSFSSVVKYASNMLSVMKEYDSALSSISYSMDISKKGLDGMGESALKLAQNLKTSINSAMSAVKIYAGMSSSPDDIEELSKPAIIMSNLTGSDVGTASKLLQSAVRQFGLLEENSMHIADVYDYVGSRMAVSYSEGIENIAQAAQAAGDIASAAGLSFEQLAAVSAKTMEQTQQDGLRTGTILGTIFSRLSETASIEADIDSAALDKAASALKDIGVETADASGGYKKLDDIMTELAEKWDTLTDAQKSNLSYQIAATSQSSILQAVLQNWTSAMGLAAEATRTEGNAMDNYGKYMSSYTGKLQGLSTAMQTFAIHFLDSDSFKILIDTATTLVNILDKLVDTLGALPVSGAALGITAFVKSFA